MAPDKCPRCTAQPSETDQFCHTCGYDFREMVSQSFPEELIEDDVALSSQLDDEQGDTFLQYLFIGAIVIIGIIVVAGLLKYFSPYETCVRNSVNNAKSMGLGLYVDDISQIKEDAKIFCANK